MKRPRDYEKTKHDQLYRKGPDLFNRFERYLKQRGYSYSTRHSYLSSSKHFLCWLDTRPRSQKKINSDSIQSFLREHLPVCRCPMPVHKNLITVRAALNQMLFMEGHERIRTVTDRSFPKIEIEITLFDKYLKNICGLAEATRWYHRRHARKFLLWLFNDKAIVRSRITPGILCSFVSEQAASLRASSVGVLVYSLRSYLKFLQLNGYVTPSLKAKIPRPPNWSQANLPKALNSTELKRFWSSFDTITAIGKRDYAMARCLADLGLRCHEVASIQLDDIDWHNGVLCLEETKGRRDELLPIPALMGKALATYLRYGRPVTKSQNVFVYHRAPVGQAVQNSTVRGAIRRAFSRIGLPWTGTHILRGTLASQLLEGGASIKEVAELLRHRSIDTTRHYTKVDLSHLAQVALPWPGRLS